MRHRPFSELAERVLAEPGAREEVEAYKRAIRTALALARVRGEIGVTQETVADALGTTQENVSRIERQDDLYLTTLAGYVAALGGRLELLAVFPDQTMPLLQLAVNSDQDDEQPSRISSPRAAKSA